MSNYRPFIDPAFQYRVYQCNANKGFHADPATQHPAIKVALIHSETRPHKHGKAF